MSLEEEKRERAVEQQQFDEDSNGKRVEEHVRQKDPPPSAANGGASEESYKSAQDERKRKREPKRDGHAQNSNGATLYVTNVPQETRSEELRALFERFGPIEECRMINNPVTRESRGFAFLSFRSPKDAEEALKTMDGKHFEGKILRVETAKRSKPHDPTPGHYRGPTGASVKYDYGCRPRRESSPYYRGGPASRSWDRTDDRIRSHRGADSRHYEYRYDSRSNDYRNDDGCRHRDDDHYRAYDKGVTEKLSRKAPSRRSPTPKRSHRDRTRSPYDGR